MATDNNIRKEFAEISPALAGLPPASPYLLPEGYFESLPDQIMLRIRAEEAGSSAEEITLLSPLLAGLQQKPTYSVPDGYLDQLAASTLTKSGNQPETKVVPLFPGKRLFQYAAAAAVAGLVAAGAWFFTGNQPQSVYPPLARTSEASIEKQIQSQANKVPDSELVRYLDNNLNPVAIEAAVSTEDLNKDDLEVLLADVSDQELQHYLDHDDPRAEKLN